MIGFRLERRSEDSVHRLCCEPSLQPRAYQWIERNDLYRIERALLKKPPKKYAARRELAEKKICCWNGNVSLQYVFPSTIGSSRKYYPANLFENMKIIEFNGKQYICAADVDATLRVEYGDYMQLPPEED